MFIYREAQEVRKREREKKLAPNYFGTRRELNLNIPIRSVDTGKRRIMYNNTNTAIFFL